MDNLGIGVLSHLMGLDNLCLVIHVCAVDPCVCSGSMCLQCLEQVFSRHLASGKGNPEKKA